MYYEKLLKDIDFESESNSNAWDNINYYFCFFRKLESGVISYLKGNITFEKLNGLSEQSRGKPINQILEESKVQLFCNLYDRYSGTDQCTHFVDHVSTKEGDNIWDVLVVFDDMLLKCMGVCKNSKCEESIIGYHRFQEKMIGYYEADDSILICKKRKGYVIENISDGICNLFKEKSHVAGSLLLEVMPTSIDKDKMSHSIEKCIMKKAPVCYYENYNDLSDFTYIHFTMLPMIFHKAVKILINIRYVSSKENIINKKCMPSFEESYHEAHFGVCQIDTVNRNSCYITRINTYLEKLIMNNVISTEEILNSDTLVQSLDDKIDTYGRIILCGDDGTEYEFYIQVVPYIMENNVPYVQLILFPDNYGYSNYKLLNNVTHRQKEIADLVLKGYTNKYISNILFISEGTVKKTLYNIYRKLGVNSRVEMLRIFMGRRK